MADSDSLFRPSAAERWMTCAGSADHIEGHTAKHGPEATSPYAAEGTAAHAEAERILVAMRDDMPFDLPDDPEVAKYVGQYVSYVTEQTSGELSTLLVEERVDLSELIDPMLSEALRPNWHIGPILAGTADAIELAPGRVQVFDLKYGQGVEVEALGNAQLAIYGVGAIALYREKFPDVELARVELVIVQPRKCREPKTWVVDDPDDFFDYWSKRIVEGIEASLSTDSTLTSGEHCRFCPGRVSCPEVKSELFDEMLEDFADAPDVNLGELVRSKPDEYLVKLHRNASLIQSYLKAVAAHLFGAAQKGDDVEGFKLVNRIGNRAWSVDDEKVMKLLRARKLKKAQFTKTTLLGPAAVEKILDNPKFFKQYVHRPILGAALVPLSDKREALKPAIKDDFEDVSDDLDADF